MNLTVNGKPASIDDTEALNVHELLDALKVEQAEYVTVELNGDIIDRDDFVRATVRDGDAVEFLYFMGGGF
jgi:sulfur carrier protein